MPLGILRTDGGTCLIHLFLILHRKLIAQNSSGRKETTTSLSGKPQPWMPSLRARFPFRPVCAYIVVIACKSAVMSITPTEYRLIILGYATE